VGVPHEGKREGCAQRSSEDGELLCDAQPGVGGHCFDAHAPQGALAMDLRLAARAEVLQAARRRKT